MASGTGKTKTVVVPEDAQLCEVSLWGCYDCGAEYAFRLDSNPQAMPKYCPMCGRKVDKEIHIN